MEDLRRNLLEDRIKKRQKWINFLNIIKKNAFNIIFIIIIIMVFIFPSTIGDIFGIWFNKLATAFINKLTF